MKLSNYKKIAEKLKKKMQLWQINALAVIVIVDLQIIWSIYLNYIKKNYLMLNI